MTQNRQVTTGPGTPIWTDPLLFETRHADAPAANTAAEITYVAEVGKRHQIAGVAWSYNDDPAGNLMIHDGNNHIFFQVDITTGGPGFFNFYPEQITADKNQPLTITLAAGGAAISGKINVLGYRKIG